jgi:hypothetical protein
MKKKWILIITLTVVLVIVGLWAYQNRWSLYLYLTSRGINSKGRDITIINAKIWTGDPGDPWKTAMTVQNGKIIAMDAANPTGKVIDAQGRLIVPGFCDGHTHPQTPFMLVSAEAPMLFQAKSVDDVPSE